MPEMRGGIQNKKAGGNAGCTLPAPDGLRRTHTHLVLLSLKDNQGCLLLNAPPPPHSLSLSFSFSLLSPPSLSFSFSPSISLHLLDTLPHQLFSSHTEMTPQGNVILIVCVCVCVCVFGCTTHTQSAYVPFSLVLYSASSTSHECPLL